MSPSPMSAAPPESFFVFVVGHCEEWPENRDEQGDAAIYKEYLDFGVPEDQCLYLKDGDCTKQNCQERLEGFLQTFAQAKEKTTPTTTAPLTLVFYYGGHGSANGFCTIGGTWTYRAVANTIQTRFHGNRVMYLLDCCAAGNLWKHLSEEKESIVLGTSQPYVTSSSEGEEWILSNSWIRMMRNNNSNKTEDNLLLGMETVISVLSDRHLAGLGDLFFAYWTTKNNKVLQREDDDHDTSLWSWMPSRSRERRKNPPTIEDETTEEHDIKTDALVQSWLPQSNGPETLMEMPRKSRILSVHDCRIGDAIGYKYPGGCPLLKSESEEELSFYVPPLWLHGKIVSIFEKDTEPEDSKGHLYSDNEAIGSIFFRIRVWYPSQENHPWEVEVCWKSRRLVNQFWIAQIWMLPRQFERTQVLLAKNYGQYLDHSLTDPTRVRLVPSDENNTRAVLEGRILDWKDFNWKQLHDLHRILLSSDGDPIFPGKTKYDEYYWDELPVPARTAALALGYTKSHWDDDIEIQADSTDYKDLTEDQQEAAAFLGYVRQSTTAATNQSSNNGVPMVVPLSTSPGPHVPVVWNDTRVSSLVPLEQIIVLPTSVNATGSREVSTNSDEQLSNKIQSLIRGMESCGKTIGNAASIFGTSELTAFWPEDETWCDATPIDLPENDIHGNNEDANETTLKLLATHFEYPLLGVYCPILYDDGVRYLVPASHIFRRSDREHWEDEDNASKTDDESSSSPSDATEDGDHNDIIDELTRNIHSMSLIASSLGDEDGSKVLAKLNEVTLLLESLGDPSTEKPADDTRTIDAISNTDDKLESVESIESPNKGQSRQQTTASTPNHTKAQYYDAHWKDLPSHVKKAAKRIGYTRRFWDDDEGIPIENKDWNDLTIEEKTDLELLGYTKDTWETKDDSEDDY